MARASTLSTFTTPVVIGPLVLAGAEVPSVFERGETMQPVIHRLIGGGRVVQLMGRDTRPRELRGLLLGPNAIARALALEAVHDAGEPVLLAIGAWVELVVVTALTVDYTAQGSVIAYRLRAEVAPPVASVVPDSLVALVQSAISDLGIAAAAVGGGGRPLAGAAALIGNASSGLASAVPVLPGSAAPTFDQAPIASALGGSIASAGAALASAVGANGLVGSAGSLTAATAAAGTLAIGVQAAGYVNRAAATIGGLSGLSVLPAIYA